MNTKAENQKIRLDHGSGGRLSHELTRDMILPVFGNDVLNALHDGAVFAVEKGRLAFSTDTYTVDPLFFPGGNIGDLAINGTVNDIAMCGAVPRYLSLGLIIEEGLAVADLKTILATMGRAAQKAGVMVVTGDTKVVPKGAADKLFVNTSGVGLIPAHVRIGADRARSGDQIILSGTIGDHGITIMTRREGMQFDAPFKSDSAPLNHLVESMLVYAESVHVLRDPTRGGLATALNEIAAQSAVGIRIFEDRIPVRPDVAGACELLGFDPLYLANEGKLVAFVAPDMAQDVLKTMHTFAVARNACIIGEVVPENPGRVVMETAIKGLRIVDMLTGEQLPRIC